MTEHLNPFRDEPTPVWLWLIEHPVATSFLLLIAIYAVAWWIR